MHEIFFTADTHFDHASIIVHTQRPFETVEEMNETLVENWNKVVKPKDTVYILGDFAWKRHMHWQGRLRGHQILIKGNHDKMSQVALRNFTEVHDICCRRIDKEYVVMCHYPMLGWRSKAHSSWHFHGHVHGTTSEHNDVRRCDVGVDAWDFRPIPWSVLRLKMKHKTKYEAEYDHRAKAQGRKDALGVINERWRELEMLERHSNISDQS